MILSFVSNIHGHVNKHLLVKKFYYIFALRNVSRMGIFQFHHSKGKGKATPLKAWAGP
jgi:hypothetical protein